jgi:hypothetical protein
MKSGKRSSSSSNYKKKNSSRPLSSRLVKAVMLKGSRMHTSCG